MIIYRILFGIVLGITFQAAAQRGLPPAFELKADNGGKIILDTIHFQILPHASKVATLKDALHESADSSFTIFHDSLSTKQKNVAWFRFRIKNNVRRDIIVTFFNVEARSEIYIRNASGKWKRFVTGYAVPISERDGVRHPMQILFPLKNGEEITVYKKVACDVFVEQQFPSFGIYDTVHDNFTRDAFYFNTILTSALFGFMMFAALFNFFFYFIVRERVYLFYAFTLLSAAIFNVSEFLLELLLGKYPYLSNSVQFGLIFLIIILIPFTLRLFLQTKKTFPVWDRILSFFPLVFIALVGIATFKKFIDLDPLLVAAIKYSAAFLILFYFVGIIIMLIIYLRRKDASARLLTIAIIPFFLAMPASYNEAYAWISVIGLIWAIGVISWSLFVKFRALMDENNRQALEKERLAREKEEERNALIAQQNEILEKQVSERTAELTKSLKELKLTQNQLIQSEKMASLGELTAGIAHEIQNPLNFVNNFSDVSVELLGELDEEARTGNTKEVLTISSDLKHNLEKIVHHGRRADSIVKGMLQHSRASSGQKEPTDINALTDEYLRLAYHGLRAKDKNFNAELITDFDSNHPKVNIVPQDIGRVLLNLFNNAFYAVQEKGKHPQSANYKPTVEVRTFQKENVVQIMIKDNGIGIPEAIKGKILQPFFTTKPTGDGTGLGLSLSYDIVVKWHGGTIDIESVEGAEFIITLPL